jgi:hypothetical protein
MKTNTKAKTAYIDGAVAGTTYGGGASKKAAPLEQLERAVFSCLLFEETHYQTGSAIANQIRAAAKLVDPADISRLAISARQDHGLRSVALYLVALLDENKGRIPFTERSLIANTVYEVISRADELAELCALIQKLSGKPLKKCLSNQVKKGLARAFTKFKEHSLAKYDRNEAIKLRDVLFLCHAKPLDGVSGFDARVRRAATSSTWASLFKHKTLQNSKGSALFERLIEGKLATPRTWETELSSGMDKKESFTGLIEDGKLGGLAVIRNLRNMEEAEVGRPLIRKAIANIREGSGILPFQFFAAMKTVPTYEPELSYAMVRSLRGTTRLPGSTLVVIDVSGSMGAGLSGKSTLDLIEASSGLAIIVREIADSMVLYATAGSDYEVKHATALVPATRGFALYRGVEEAKHKLGGGGIFLKQCMEYIEKEERGAQFDRVIVLTDEQDCDKKRSAANAPLLGKINYIVNVAPYNKGLAASKGWVRINGFSDRVIDFILLSEGYGQVSNQEAVEA